jgi:hypothetical protein
MERHEFTWEHMEEYFEEMSGVESYTIYEPESSQDPTPSECTIFVDGGIVQWVGFNGEPLNVTIIDADIDGISDDEESIKDIRFTDGKVDACYIYQEQHGFNYGDHQFIQEED